MSKQKLEKKWEEVYHTILKEKKGGCDEKEEKEKKNMQRINLCENLWIYTEREV